MGNAYSQEQDSQVSDSQEADSVYWQFSFDGGYSYRTGEIKEVYPEVVSYLNGLRSGYLISGKGICFINKFVGIGVSVSVSKYYNEADKLNAGREIIKNVSDDITIGYVAPSVEFRAYASDNGRHVLPFDISIGALWYKDDAQFNSKSVVLSGTTIGFGVGAGYDFSVTKNIAFGIKTSFIFGYLSSYYTDINNNGVKERNKLDDDKESLSHFKLSAGIRFNF